MVVLGNIKLCLCILYFLQTFSYISCSTNTTTAVTTQTVSTNNGIWMVVGIICCIIVVLITIAAGCVCFHKHKKRVHPHSDTETFYSESETYTRPTTASHIGFEPEEEAMSKPVPMTPFELRKLYVETFPYSKWRKSFDGHLRPHMGLRFVDPRLYARAKFEERSFRNQIFNYEMSDTLTLRSSSVSRLTRPVITAMSNLETLQEVPSNSSETQHPSTGRSYEPETEENDVKRSVMQGDDVEL